MGTAAAFVVFGVGDTIMDEVIGRNAASPDRMLVTGRSMGLVAEAAKADINRFTTILSSMSVPSP